MMDRRVIMAAVMGLAIISSLSCVVHFWGQRPVAATIIVFLTVASWFTVFWLRRKL